MMKPLARCAISWFSQVERAVVAVLASLNQHRKILLGKSQLLSKKKTLAMALWWRKVKLVS